MKAPSRNGNRAHIATCAECGCASSLLWVGWGAYRMDDPETNAPLELAFLCPACAAAEFDAKPASG